MFGGEVVAGAGAQPAQGFVPVDLLELRELVLLGVLQAQQLCGQRHLGAVEGHEVDRLGVGPLPRQRLADGALCGDELIKAGFAERGVHGEDFDGGLDQLLAWQKAVSGVRALREGVLETGFDAFRGVMRNADGLRDGVRGLEADAPHVGGQLVGL